MNSDKVKKFMTLGGQKTLKVPSAGDAKTRELGALLLLSETLEYVIKGLGVTPSFNGVEITDANGLKYHANKESNLLEMLDGLADVAYTMYWNTLAFGLPLEPAFDAVCDNNLEKFVLLKNWNNACGQLTKSDWHCDLSITWPSEVVTVEVLQVGSEFYAVGKDQGGKVRKPSSYRSVELEKYLVAENQ